MRIGLKKCCCQSFTPFAQCLQASDVHCLLPSGKTLLPDRALNLCAPELGQAVSTFPSLLRSSAASQSNGRPVRERYHEGWPAGPVQSQTVNSQRAQITCLAVRNLLLICCEFVHGLPVPDTEYDSSRSCTTENCSPCSFNHLPGSKFSCASLILPHSSH